MPVRAASSPGGADRRWPWRALGAQRRAVAFAALAAGVLLLHLALLHEAPGSLGPPLRRPADAPAPIQVVLASRAEVTVQPARPPRPAPLVTPPVQRRRPTPPPPPAPPTPRAPAAETEAAAPAAAPPADAPADPPVTTAPAPEPVTAPPEAGTAPPVYPVVPPPDRTLDYRVVRGEAQGLAQLRWQSTPGSYTLSLQASAAGGQALDWISRGGFDAAGLAPQRMVERQRDKDVHAVNFQRDKALISFSGPSRVVPLLRGAQDRLSWLIQLVAVVQARNEALKEGDTLRFQVASPRGDVDEWVFLLVGTAAVDASGAHWNALKLVREPQRPYDQRVEVWLAPSAGHLPLGLTLTTVPGGVPLALWLTGGLQPPS